MWEKILSRLFFALYLWAWCPTIFRILFIQHTPRCEFSLLRPSRNKKVIRLFADRTWCCHKHQTVWLICVNKKHKKKQVPLSSTGRYCFFFYFCLFFLVIWLCEKFMRVCAYALNAEMNMNTKIWGTVILMDDFNMHDMEFKQTKHTHRRAKLTWNFRHRWKSNLSGFRLKKMSAWQYNCGIFFLLLMKLNEKKLNVSHATNE